MFGKKILITGGEGFIGSYLCEYLVSENTVYSLDNRLMPRSYHRVPGVTYIYGDCENIFQLIPDINFDLVFHLGEYSRVEQSVDEPLLCLRNVRNAFTAVIEYCRINKSKLIYSGSSTKFTTDNLGKSLSPYTFAKASNTELIINYMNWYGLDAAIVYFYNVYGEREQVLDKYATVVAKFLELKRQGEKFAPVTSPGTQRRNFTHVQDIVSGLKIVAEHGYGDGYGIGSEESYSILELAELIGLKPTYKAQNSSNRHDADLVVRKTKELGWRCNQSLEQYIYQTVKKIMSD